MTVAEQNQFSLSTVSSTIAEHQSHPRTLAPQSPDTFAELVATRLIYRSQLLLKSPVFLPHLLQRKHSLIRNASFQHSEMIRCQKRSFPSDEWAPSLARERP